jgi:hypothetical protein
MSGPPTVDLDHFRRTGWALVDTLDAEAVARVRGYVDEIAAWGDGGEWLHYRELTDRGPALCRTENFTPFHPGMRELLSGGAMVAVASTLLEHPAVLYKEKINYKLSGGAGYAPHQDAPAYRFVDQHVSCMVAIDDATVDNGCLEVVSGMHHEILEQDERGCIAGPVVASMSWETVELRAGQTLWFHSRTPHRSGPNHTTTDRRALYPTYNALSEGDLRDRYYAQKLTEFAAATAATADGRPAGVKVSLIDDFEGRPVI